MVKQGQKGKCEIPKISTGGNEGEGGCNVVLEEENVEANKMNRAKKEEADGGSDAKCRGKGKL